MAEEKATSRNSINCFLHTKHIRSDPIAKYRVKFVKFIFSSNPIYVSVQELSRPSRSTAAQFFLRSGVTLHRPFLDPKCEQSTSNCGVGGNRSNIFQSSIPSIIPQTRKTELVCT